MNKNNNPEQREASREAAQVDNAATLEAEHRDREAFNPHISMYSMTLTLLQLVELYDNQPGKERRYKLLDEIAKEFRQFTGIRPCR